MPAPPVIFDDFTVIEKDKYNADLKERDDLRRQLQSIREATEVLHAAVYPLAVNRAKLFHLSRTKDVSGVSGTGKVAEGVQFSDGRVALRWVVGEHRSTVTYDDIESVERIHGHDGATTIVWE